MLSSAARAMCATLLPRVSPTIVPRASGCQYGAPSPVKAGTNITPPLSGTDAASCSTSLLALDRVQPVAQPLHHRAADEDAAFERVVASFGADLRRAGRDQAVGAALECRPVCISAKQPVP